MIKIKNILVGITGSIAAYKTISLISDLKKSGYNVKCILTKNATHFITPLTLQTLSQNKVFTNTFATAEEYIDHIELVKWADIMLIAPATANFIAKAAAGIADDMLTSIFLAINYNVPIMISPAMNTEMWDNPITQKNINILKSLNATILLPQHGLQACGDIGVGRMMEPEDIFEYINNLNKSDFSLKGKKILITAGPTIEQLDPIRYLSNHSSGKMGYALVTEALNQGAEVLLITGPTNIEKPCCKVISINTADEMHSAVLKHISDFDVFISAAAVSDYKPKEQSKKKIKKTSEELSLTLVRNVDILKDIRKRYPNKAIVGFAAETCDLEQNALKKLQDKNLNMIIANNASAINSDQNEVIIIDKQLNKVYIPLSSKESIAKQIIHYIATNKQ